MENYEVIGLLGEGSFGRVYKAKQTATNEFVALKVISKRGRSAKELKGLRRECKIQRDLHHRNIIQMLDSFETENEIVVITEFAHKELYVILGKEGYLPEERVQTIVWDLVSALYYLHSHRVLHRDLKPQNILLDVNNVAKLCDFGFARNMSTGTHVLTSIKGTPLYMAPELIEELPYDHNADLWSLGCIIYELLVGVPPFCTVSILHLIRLIKHEQIKWPNFLSEPCKTFLEGLLEKNPSKRLTWPALLEHPFVKGHILITEDSTAMALTKPMTWSVIQAKAQQWKDHHHLKNPTVQNNNQTSSKSDPDLKSKTKETPKPIEQALSDLTINKLSPVSQSNTSKKNINQSNDFDPNKLWVNLNEEDEAKSKICSYLSYNFYEDSQPLENEEWTAFLQKTTEEVLNGELSSLLQLNFANIIISPLRNTNVSASVITDIIILLSSAYQYHESLEEIMKMYLKLKVIPNILYALKLLLRHKDDNVSQNSKTPTPSNSPIFPPIETYKPVNELTDTELKSIEYAFLFICNSVYKDIRFLNQFCDSVVVLKLYNLLQQLLLLTKINSRIVTDLIAILIGILKLQPENYSVVHKIMLSSKSPHEESKLIVAMLKNSYVLLRERTCYFILYLSYNSLETLEAVWTKEICETLEDLCYDSIQKVRNVAERVVEELKTLKFYTT